MSGTILKKDAWLREVEILRAFAIILIVLHHFDIYTNFKYFSIFNGYLAIIGLGLFFFLSGYILYHNHSKISNINDIFTFYKKRLIRIIPLYWVAIILSVIILGYYGLDNEIHDYSLLSIIAHGLGLQAIFGFSIPFFWFISVILIFYALYPIIIYFTNDNNKYIILLSIFIVITTTTAYSIFPSIDNRMNMYFLVFIAGIIARKINLFYDIKYEKYIPVFLLTLISMLIIEYFFFNGGNYIVHGFSIINAVMAVLFLIVRDILLFSLCPLAYWLIKKYLYIINSHIIKILYDISFGSYATYLFHNLWFVIFKYILIKLNFNEILIDIILLVVALPIVFLLCYYIQLLERSFFKYINLKPLKKLKVVLK